MSPPVAANIASALVSMASERPDALAIAAPVRGRPRGREHDLCWSYRELNDASDRIARGLQAHGIGRGVRTALMVRPGLDLFAITFALFKVAAAAVTGWVGGALTEALGGEPTPLGDDVSGAEDTAGARTWRDGVDHGLTLLRTIWGWLAIGVIASAAIEVFVPSEAYASLTAHG